MQGTAIRDVLDDAIPHAEQFIHARTRTVPGVPSIVDDQGNLIRAGTPEREIITVAFDMASLTVSYEKTSNVMRRSLGESTDNLQLSGAALDAYIERQLARLTPQREVGFGAGPDEDSDADGDTEF